MNEITKTFDFMPLGDAIKNAREKNGLTREQLAEQLGITPRHLQFVENEGQHPGFQLFVELVTMFDISVTTKNDNYFYILIDRAAEGENTVHFLNMVDEADLMALIKDGEKEETTVMPQTCTCKEKCEAGAVNEGCPVCLNNRNSCIGTEKETEPEETGEPEKPKNDKGTKSLLLLFLLTLFAGGGAFYYFKFIKPKDTAKGSPDFSNFDFDEDEETDYEDDTDYDGYGDDTDGADDTEADEETDYGDDTENEETGLEDDTEGGV